MKPKNWPFTNPIVSNLYGKPPLVWKDMRVQLVVYETDFENIKKVIPDPLEPRTNKVITWISEFQLGTTQGGFKEAAIYVQVKYKDYEGDYEPFLYVNSPLPLTGGREIWGYQKKMADINLALDQEAVVGKVTRLEHQIIKCTTINEYVASMAEIPWSRDGVFSLKYIPSAEANGEPIRELVLTEGKFTAHEGKFFGGRASVIFERTEIDPTYLLEPKKILGGYFGEGELFLPFGKIVHNYK
uniref:Acetoacetate decarboxylase n=1 Tax=candidate division WOR-3 bacterium TaxID=2052148 RepID=A0A7V3KP81_UNCW3